MRDAPTMRASNAITSWAFSMSSIYKFDLGYEGRKEDAQKKREQKSR